MTSGLRLNTEMRDTLFEAQRMIRLGREKHNLNNNEMYGQIKTVFQEKILGSIAGIEFQAEVTTEIGEGKVKFLVQPLEVTEDDQINWIDFDSIDDLFESMRPPAGRANAAFN